MKIKREERVSRILDNFGRYRIASQIRFIKWARAHQTELKNIQSDVLDYYLDK